IRARSSANSSRAQQPVAASAEQQQRGCMIRVLFRWVANIAAALAPIVALRYSPLDWFKWAHPQPDDLVHFGFFTASKETFDLEMSVMLAVVAVTLICVVEFVDLYLPKIDLERFRSDYLDN